MKLRQIALPRSKYGILTPQTKSSQLDHPRKLSDTKFAILLQNRVQAAVYHYSTLVEYVDEFFIVLI